jgi:hypothetical protein
MIAVAVVALISVCILAVIFKRVKATIDQDLAQHLDQVASELEAVWAPVVAHTDRFVRTPAWSVIAAERREPRQLELPLD